MNLNNKLYEEVYAHLNFIKKYFLKLFNKNTSFLIVVRWEQNRSNLGNGYLEAKQQSLINRVRTYNFTLVRL